MHVFNLEISIVVNAHYLSSFCLHATLLVTYRYYFIASLPRALLEPPFPSQSNGLHDLVWSLQFPLYPISNYAESLLVFKI